MAGRSTVRLATAKHVMAERDEIAQVVGEANRAMSAGDHAAAERALRRALKLQEDQLGQVHPDVVNTLNDLGVVCDILGRPREAEFLYRRALGIARRTLEPGHPYIATSLQNLADLYKAQGEPEKIAKLSDDKEPRSGLPTRAPVDDVMEPTPGPEVKAAPSPVVTPTPAERSPAPTPRAAGAASSAWTGRGVAIAVAGVALLVALWLVFGRGGSEAQSSGPVTTGGSVSEPSAPVVSPVTSDVAAETMGRPAVPIEAPVGERSAAEATEPPPASSSETVSSEAPSPGARPTGVVDEGPLPSAVSESRVVVVDARVCGRLDIRGPAGERLVDWRCEALPDPTGPGQIYFYTRLRSPRSATVEHRWFRDGVLQQEVALEIAANDGPGYRTYSVRSVSSSEQGVWRVELLSPARDPLFMDEFVVR